MNKKIYCDYAATTPCDPIVVEKMYAALSSNQYFGNASSSSHWFGWQARELIEANRNSMAEALNIEPEEVIWTSGATEANNLIIYGVVKALEQVGKKGHIVTTQIEHPSVYEVMQSVAKLGWDVSFVQPESSGVIDASKLLKAVRKDTILVSVMYVNNETGVINPIQAIAKSLSAHNAMLHVDAVQAAGKLPIDLSELAVDFMTFSAHKFYGPKGVGMAYIRKECASYIEPLQYGGGHEQNKRSGTLPTHQIVGLTEAYQLSIKTMRQECEQQLIWRLLLEKSFLAIGGIIHGEAAQRLSNIVNVAFNGVDGEQLINALENIAVSSGSACNTKSILPSRVLRAMKVSEVVALNSIRISIGRYTREDEIKQIIEQITSTVEVLRT